MPDKMSDKAIFLVGVDGSDCSLRALDMALDLAKNTETEIVCAYAMWLQGFEIGVIQAGGYPDLLKEHTRVNESDRDRVFNAVDARAIGHTVTVTKVSDVAAPVAYMQSLIEEYQPKILFLGKQGRSTFDDLLVGSISNRLVHTITTPIMLVS